jgi:hypothetical protein
MGSERGLFFIGRVVAPSLRFRTGMAAGNLDNSEGYGDASGCTTPSVNGYVAPITAAAGQTYLMLVNSPLHAGRQFILTVGGTAVVSCSALGIGSDPEGWGQPEVRNEIPFIWPAVTSGVLHTETEVAIVDHTGRAVARGCGTVDLSALPNGLYTATDGTRNRRFLISR